MPDHDLKAPQSGAATHSHFRLVVSQTLTTDEVSSHKYHGSGTAEDPFIVDWIPNDPKPPLELGHGMKWLITIIMSFASLSLTLSSTSFSGVSPQIRQEFDASSTLAVGTISLFVLGFALGGMVWGPSSEIYGRQIIYAATFFLFTLFGGASIASTNIATLFVTRFFAGFFGSSSITNAGGVISDIFDTHERGLAIMVYTSAPFLGPTLGPIASGFLGQAGGWRWVDGLGVILSGVVFLLGVVIVPETYAPYILSRRAKKLSQKTGKAYLSKLDIGRTTVPSEIVQQALVRPWAILFLDPLALTICIYAAIIYGILYLSFAAFPIIFVGHRGWSLGVAGLAYLGILIGQMAAMVFYVFLEVRFRKRIAKDPSRKTPEARLEPSYYGAIALPIGLFWFAWTTYTGIHWIVGITGSSLFGFGQVLLFISLMNYAVDSYTVFAASALAASAILRALFGAAFPLFTPNMYENLGTQWASSVPAFLGLACAPLPFLFYRYGKGLRERSKYSSEAQRIMNEMTKRSVAVAVGPTEKVDAERGVEPAGSSSDQDDHSGKVEV